MFFVIIIELYSKILSAEKLAKIAVALNVEVKELFDFGHHQTNENLKQELIYAISEEKVDISLLYRFYEALK